ncbi:hypothetical protein EV368DRAFT_64628 [Lentinula lateritia]|nr:hypothetical protein EV368DRAFT_64628 [Lentinula lateritia]
MALVAAFMMAVDLDLNTGDRNAIPPTLSVLRMNMAGTNYLEFEMQYASIALIWYDWVLMFPMEARSNISGDQRFEYPPSFTSSATMHYSPTCNTWYKIIGALSVLGRAAIICPVISLLSSNAPVYAGACTVSFTARAYAVWGRKRMVFVYLASVGILCVGVDIAHVPGLRCEGPSSMPIATDLLSILTVVFEFSSAVLISVRCIQTFKDRRRSSNNESIKGFWDLTFQQGLSLDLILSFMSVFTTTSVILNFRAPAGFYQRLLNALTLPLSGLLTSRFILHLRKCEHDLSDLERVAVDTVNSMVAGDILSSVIEPHFGWDPVEVDALLRADLGLTENTV